MLVNHVLLLEYEGGKEGRVCHSLLLMDTWLYCMQLTEGVVSALKKLPAFSYKYMRDKLHFNSKNMWRKADYSSSLPMDSVHKKC